MAFKPSEYNFFFKAVDGDYLAYNGLTNSLAHVTVAKYRIIQKIIKDPNLEMDEDEQKLKSDLMKGGFLLDEKIDEIEILRMKNKIGRFTSEFFGVTIAPTLKCNFKCSYCFEERKSDRMSQDTENKLIKFIENKIKKVKEFGVTWFGGEPLLEIDLILRLSKSFSDLCQKYDVKFPPQKIITNGYLLIVKNAEKLKSVGITLAQITLDGPPFIHDKRRILTNGAPTFNTILENIKNAKDILNIQIRINVDMQNIELANELVDLLVKHDLIQKVPFYLGRVAASTSICGDIQSHCLSMKDYSNSIIDMINTNKHAKSLLDYPMIYHFGVCGADKLNSFVITPDGTLFKCWTETNFSEENSVGTIFESGCKPHQIQNLTRYLNWDPLSLVKCKKCRYFPICGGGCPYFAMNKMEKCTTWKYYLKKMLKHKYQSLVANKEA